MKRFAIAALLAFCAISARADTINVGTINTASGSVQISAGGMASVTFVVSGTFSATITPQFTLDGTAWQTATVTGPYPATTPVTTVTGAGTWQVSASSWGSFRLLATSYTSGTATVTEYASSAPLAGGSGGGGAGPSTNVVYNSTPPVLTNGQSAPTQGDSSANTKTTLATLLWMEDATNSTGRSTNKVIVASTYTPSLDTSFGTAVTHNSKASAGVIYGVDVTNVSTSLVYFQIFNSTGGTGTVLMSFPVPAGTATVPTRLSLGPSQWGPNGLYLSTGVTWGISTTNATYTGATAANHNVNLFYYRSAGTLFDAVDTDSLKRPAMTFNTARRTCAEAW